MQSAVPPSDPASPTLAGHTESNAKDSSSDSPLSLGQSRPPDAPSIPDHELLRPIGSGAYGEVWLARNAVGTLRAVKIVRRDRHVTAESFEREFKGLQKFEPVSRSHEGLVDILTLGLLTDGAGFYYVMELADSVEMTNDECQNPKEARNPNDETASRREPVRASSFGFPSSFEIRHSDLYSPRTLRADLKSRGALTAADVIALGLKLTAALAHLHAQRLVHRDVKPSNILFIDCEPKLADAGLVAAVDDARSLVGTAGYIAPEGPGTPPADLYALGKVLYEAAFGKDRKEFPALPADVASRPDHTRLLELNAILLKACAVDSRERYQSADQMRADLQLLCAGRSVKRRHVWQRSKHLAQKLALMGSAVAVVSGIVYSLALRGPQSSSFKKSSVAEANEEYKRGMDELHLNLNAPEAIKHFEKATQFDPKFAAAYAQLAEAWFSIPGEANSRNGQKAAEKAVFLEPQSGLAHAAFAATKTFTLDFGAAERENKLALKLSPDSEQVLLVSALSFALLGRTNDALASLKKAIEVGQNTPSKLRVIYSGFVYGWCRKYDEAIDLYNGSPWLRDGVDSPHYEQSRYYLAKGDFVNSMRLGRQSALESGGDPERVNAEFDALETAFKKSGPRKYWELTLEFETPKKDDGHFMRMAAIHARLNQPDKALEYLHHAKQKTPVTFACEINTDPSFDSLREDARFRELIDALWRKK